MLKRLLFTIGIGYLMRKLNGGRRMPRTYGTRW
jgi:hypothetical protein